MKLSYTGLACIVLLLTSSPTDTVLGRTSLVLALKRMQLETPVRVLLQELAPDSSSLVFTSTRGFFIGNPTTKTIDLLRNTELTVEYNQGIFYCNGKPYEQEHFVIVPVRGRFMFESISYDGYISFHRKNESIFLINHVGLEDYITGVLPYENIPSWPDEVQKAQCIACRSYALYICGLKKEQPFDLKNNEYNQMYRGNAHKTSLRNIVDATKDMILTHNDAPICAMYSSVCGGVIPSDIETDIFKAAPYLKRSYACTYCSNARLYRWTLHYPLKDIEKTLQKSLDLSKLNQVSCASYDKAGIGNTILLRDSAKEIAIPASHFRKHFPKIRSRCCSFSTKKGIVTAEGKGHGHHIGYCQWGAYSMAKLGFSCEDILAYYYPTSTLTKLARVA